MEIRKSILTVASMYKGQKEKPANSGFQNSDFEKEMKGVGWKPGESWCAYFVRLVFKKAQPDNKTFNDLLSPSAVATLANFEKNLPRYISKVPSTGDVFIMQKYSRGKKTWQGHIGIVSEVEKDFFWTIEGNSNDEGGREGIEVATLKRKVDFVVKPNGLTLIAFIKPIV
jgi:hypothetical protein